MLNPFIDSTEVQEDGAELNRRMARHGYLFVRGLLPAELLESLRLQLLELAAAGGWVSTESPLEEAIADLGSFCVEPQPDYNEVYHRMYKLAAFHALQHRPELLELIERMCGEPAMPHPRMIGRTIFPDREAYTTPAHQDFIPIQGSAETYTAWVPLHDLPTELGGLQVAAGSHRRGIYDFRPSGGAGGLEITDPLEGTWASAPFAQGDVLFFHSMCAHKGLPNHGRALRMSMDARYQRISDSIDGGSLQPHIKPVTWDEIYADWDGEFDDLKFYWQKWNLAVTEYDSRYYDKRDELAFEMAEDGNEQARSTLQRVVARSADAAKRQRATELLARLDASLT
jgi:hypothetical protein